MTEGLISHRLLVMVVVMTSLRATREDSSIGWVLLISLLGNSTVAGRVSVSLGLGGTVLGRVGSGLGLVGGGHGALGRGTVESLLV